VSENLLYSFRRCPYAIRARLAVAVSGQQVELVEVALRDKPESMLKLSPKGTVPVLLLGDGQVIDESIDVMHWALNLADPEGWLGPDDATRLAMKTLIDENDGEFKHHLDRTKYANRYDGVDPQQHRSEALVFLAKLDGMLSSGGGLFGDRRLLADWAILPFVRQFANIDRPLFDREVGPKLCAWLDRGLGSELFVEVMRKRA
jgi:glutathione S-transferase